MLDKVKAGPTIKGMYINGQWVNTPTAFDDLNPSDGSLWTRVPDGGAAEARAAIDAAHGAFPAWSALPFQERANLMLKCAEVFESRKADFIEAAQSEGGGWYGKGAYEAKNIPEFFKTAAAMCYAPVGEVLPSFTGKHSTAVRVPMGVIAVVSPWNFPGILATRQFVFPLAAGNCVILKPSEETPYMGGVIFAEILHEAGIPPGVFNVITSSRARVAEMGMNWWITRE